MVFQLEHITIIEADRLIDRYSTRDGFVYTQATDDMRTDPGLADELGPFLQQFSPWFDGAGGVRGVPILAFDLLTEAVLNAAMWGNRNTLGAQISVYARYGVAGGVLYVQDQGVGFDYRTAIAQIQAGLPHHHNHHGSGMRKFHESVLPVAYHGNGNLITIATPRFDNL